MNQSSDKIILSRRNLC